MPRRVHFAKGASSIPLVEFAGIYDRIAGVFGENAVVIGGRAVNLLCYNNKRNTHDIDVVIDPKTNPDTKIGIIQSSGFSIGRDKNGRVKTLVDDATGVSIDLYYKRELGGVRIQDIIDTAVLKEEMIGGRAYKIRVAAPLTLILMKYSAWNEDRAGVGPRQGKDSSDIRNLVQNQYGTPANFLRTERDTLSEFFGRQDALERFMTDIELIFSSPLHR